MKKICPVCGREFETRNNHKKYCSFACAGEAKYIRDLNYHRERRRTDPEFREKRCEYTREYLKEHPRKPKERRFKTCVVCGKEIPEDRSKNAKTCSPECSKIRHAQVAEEWHRNFPVDTRKPRKPVIEETAQDMVISLECGIPCSECELDYCPYE